MSLETPIRLEFERPPLIEQAISIAFEPLQNFKIVDYGLFWAEIAENFPAVSSDIPLDNPTENFEEVRSQNLSFSLMAAPPMPRAMFKNGAGELVQVQWDRFGFNWAKEGDADYPHSEAVMSRFLQLFETFSRFIEKRRIGELKIKQCELTNLNVIPVVEFGDDYGDMAKALKVDRLDLGIPYLKAETYIRNRQHRIVGEGGRAIGRLHTAISPVISTVDSSHAFRLEFTARSAPIIRSLDEACWFFGVARNAINGAFDALITDEMKQRWGEKS